MNRCTDVTLRGRCGEVVFSSEIDGPNPRCYYHKKIRDGLTTSADTIVVVEDWEIDG